MIEQAHPLASACLPITGMCCQKDACTAPSIRLSQQAQVIDDQIQTCDKLLGGKHRHQDQMPTDNL